MLQYDPKEIKLTVAGRAMSFFATDSFISLKPVTEAEWTSHVGAGGETGWSKNNDNRHTLTVTVLPFSQDFDFLQALQVAGTSFPVTLENPGAGSYIGGGLDGKITKRTTVDFGKEAKDVAYEITVNDWVGIRKNATA